MTTSTTTSIRCGNCKELHGSVAEVKACYKQGGIIAKAQATTSAQVVERTAPATGAPASDKQRTFITSLASQRVVPAANPADAPMAYVERVEDVLGGKFVSKAEASKVIEWLLTLPKLAGKYDGPTAATNPYVNEAKRGDVHVVDGIYYRIHVAQGSGRPYAAKAIIFSEAEWAEDGSLLQPGQVRWERAKGFIFKLTEDTKATAEQAEAFCRMVGRCCFCSHAIDTPESVQAGYGPVCAAKYGLPWG